MYNRIELPIRPSWQAGLIAAGPWLLLSLAVLGMAAYSTAWISLVLPLPLLGAVERWRRCGSLTHPRAVIQIITQGPILFAMLADQTTAAVRPRPESRLCSRFVYLALESDAGTRHLPTVLLRRVGSGNTPAAPMRRFITWLRLMPPPTAPIETRAWYPEALQRLWPRGKTDDH